MIRTAVSLTAFTASPTRIREYAFLTKQSRLKPLMRSDPTPCCIASHAVWIMLKLSLTGAPSMYITMARRLIRFSFEFSRAFTTRLTQCGMSCQIKTQAPGRVGCLKATFLQRSTKGRKWRS